MTSQLPLRVLIVYDEAPARARLRDVLGDIAGRQATDIVGMAGNGEEALRFVQEHEVDVVLADIRMPGMDGMEFARHASQLDPAPQVIFTTAYDEYAVSAFELAATDYLLKPVRAERLAEALERARRNLPVQSDPAGVGAGREHFNVIERGRIVLVPVVEVCYLKAELKYVTAVTAQQEYVLDESLVQLEQEFAAHFVRIHRSCLVNRAAIVAVERQTPEGDNGWQIQVRGRTERLPISRRQWPLIKSQLQGLRT